MSNRVYCESEKLGFHELLRCCQHNESIACVL